MYAQRLEEGGVAVQCTRYPGTLHDFAVAPGRFDQAQNAIDEICTALKRVFRP